MKAMIWTALVLVAVVGCTSVSEDQRFEELGQRYLDELTALSPVSATFLGDHRFDSELDHVSAEVRDTKRQFLEQTLEDLGRIHRDQLSRAHQVDALMLENKLEEDLWRLQVLQEWAWNPTRYTGLSGGSLYSLLARDYAPLEERLVHVSARLEQFPRLFEEIRATLVPERVPQIHAETAVSQNRGALSILDNQVVPHLDLLADDERARLEEAMDTGRAAVEEHQRWLEDELLPAARGEFRIGLDLFDVKLGFTLQSKMDRLEIRRRAEERLALVRGRMYELAQEILSDEDPTATFPETPSEEVQQQKIQTALDVVYRVRPERGGIVDTAKRSLAQATQFAAENGIVTVPSDPVEIIIMPEFRRGVSLAYCDSPGPLDKGQMTFYAVSPLPEDWTPEQDESFLKEYNDMSVQVLTIHEAVPGHYLQLAHANAYPSPLRAVLSSGPFIEGWAVYSEGVMQRRGYLDGDPKFHIILLKWYLRDIANALIDQAIHTEGMTREEAMELMVTQAFQEEREAAGKWVRAQLTSAQLSTYFVGFLEHSDLRAEVEKAQGEAFDLQRYHDALLSFGSPPVHFARALMLDLPIEPPRQQ
jgi:uncharacterized protein (DUF885 family)